MTKNQNILERQRELEQFLRDLEEARRLSVERDTLKISPIAGILEKQELEQINKILETLGYPT